MRIPLLCLLLFISVNIFGQDSTVCHVMQFHEEDSADAKEELTIVYNNRGQVISETYGRFEENCLNYRIGYSVRYTYNDTLLTEKLVNEKQKSPVKYVYTHDEKGRVKTESKFVWITDPGATPVHRPGMADNANTVAGKWNQVGLAAISYDDKGRKVSYDATRLCDKNENLEKWEYDEQNRVATHQVFAHGKLVRKTDYTYFEGGYRCWEINYDAEGDLKNEMEEGQGYQAMIIHIYTLDKNGHVLSERITNEKGVEQCTLFYTYDRKWRVVRTVRHDNAGSGGTTHIYKYPE